MKSRHFHFIYTFKYLRYGFVLAIVPLVLLLFRLDWLNFLSALRQDAVILASMAAFGLLVWRNTHVGWSDTSLYAVQGILYRNRRTLLFSEIAVVEVARPLYCRVLGASIVTLYTRAAFSPAKVKLYLSRDDARQLAEQIMPTDKIPDFTYTPTGRHRLVYVLLSANLLSTLLLSFLGYRQLSDLFARETSVLREWLFDHVMLVESWFELIFPASVALVAALVVFLALLTLLFSIFRSANYRLHRYGGVLVQRQGLLGYTKRYIRLRDITVCDVRRTPLARLFHSLPVHISAGGFRGNELPLLLCPSANLSFICGALPQYEVAPLPGVNLSNRNIFGYIWRPLSLFCFSLLLLLTASRVLPTYMPLFWVPMLLFAGSLAAHAEAFFREGLANHQNRGIVLCYSRYFTRHDVLVLTDTVSVLVSEGLTAAYFGRCTFFLYTPARQRLKVRFVGRYTSRHIPLQYGWAARSDTPTPLPG